MVIFFVLGVFYVFIGRILKRVVGFLSLFVKKSCLNVLSVVFF